MTSLHDRRMTRSLLNVKTKFVSMVRHIFFESPIYLLGACDGFLSICFEKWVESSALAICEIRETLSGTEGVVGERPIVASVTALVSIQVAST